MVEFFSFLSDCKWSIGEMSEASDGVRLEMKVGKCKQCGRAVSMDIPGNVCPDCGGQPIASSAKFTGAAQDCTPPGGQASDATPRGEGGNASPNARNRTAIEEESVTKEKTDAEDNRGKDSVGTDEQTPGKADSGNGGTNTVQENRENSSGNVPMNQMKGTGPNGNRQNPPQEMGGNGNGQQGGTGNRDGQQGGGGDGNWQQGGGGNRDGQQGADMPTLKPVGDRVASTSGLTSDASPGDNKSMSTGSDSGQKEVTKTGQEQRKATYFQQKLYAFTTVNALFHPGPGGPSSEKKQLDQNPPQTQTKLPAASAVIDKTQNPTTVSAPANYSQPVRRISLSM